MIDFQIIFDLSNDFIIDAFIVDYISIEFRYLEHDLNIRDSNYNKSIWSYK